MARAQALPAHRRATEIGSVYVGICGESMLEPAIGAVVIEDLEKLRLGM